MSAPYCHTPQIEYHWAAGKLFYSVHTEVYCPVIANFEIKLQFLSMGLNNFSGLHVQRKVERTYVALQTITHSFFYHWRFKNQVSTAWRDIKYCQLKTPCTLSGCHDNLLLDMWLSRFTGYWYWLRSVLFRANLWTSFASHAKKKRILMPISSFHNRTSLIKKGFLTMAYSMSNSWVMQMAMPGGQGSPTLPAWVANHSTGFGPSCPLVEL